ncbi:hypothetical protein FHE66_14580 [Georgenia sp. 311]|uniref:hypothetical protein n=1 Tax=Georgenia sp. 311 TaxID=2585134 RepID=UPI0011119740|nr:hypothetical protein [Georgenia sp. 311]TNC16601.1 hypothetical protein FHE66_14580 [Georgenia sp. 311]
MEDDVHDDRQTGPPGGGGEVGQAGADLGLLVPRGHDDERARESGAGERSRRGAHVGILTRSTP